MFGIERLGEKRICYSNLGRTESFDVSHNSNSALDKEMDFFADFIALSGYSEGMPPI